MQNNFCVLGIESSCDETGVAVYRPQSGILAEAVYSQVEHAEWGGVVPELASRDHVRKLSPMIRAVIAEAGIEPGDLDAIAYTAGPGLAGALLVGAAVAEGLAVGLDRPTIRVHHMEGHLLSPLLANPAPDFPFLALLVSGGHTMLVEVTGPGRYRLLGETLDDAAGEAFDKTARLLGLPYPGGPEIARLAGSGDADRFDFPRPMLDRPGLDLSFSGLKTHTRLLAAAQSLEDRTRADIAAGFQQAVVDTLVAKCLRALRTARLERLVVAGGVGANTALREALKCELGNNVFYPDPGLCTDNGAMIAHAGWFRRAEAERDFRIRVHPRWALTGLEDIPAPAAV